MRARMHASRVSYFHLMASYVSVAEVHSCWCKSIMHCVRHFISQYCECQVVCLRIVHAMLSRALCMPSHSIVHARLYISCIHACHAYCIVLGIGVSPSTGNEGRFVLRVTERVSIPSHRHSGLFMMEFRFCCVYMCIHFILSRAIRLLGHHASICVIGGTRIEDYTP